MPVNSTLYRDKIQYDDNDVSFEFIPLFPHFPNDIELNTKKKCNSIFFLHRLPSNYLSTNTIIYPRK